MSIATPNSEAAIFGRLIQPEKGDLTPELARHILKIGFPEEDRGRMNELAAKARAGALTPQEERELENYNLVGDLLALWQSKARRRLEQAQPV